MSSSSSLPQTLRGLTLFSAALACAATAAAADKPVFTVLNPTSTPSRSSAEPWLPASLSGKTIYLVDETFDGGDSFLLEMQKLPPQRCSPRASSPGANTRRTLA